MLAASSAAASSTNGATPVTADAAEVAEKGVLAAIRRSEQAEEIAESARETLLEERQQLQAKIGKLEADLLEERAGR